MSKKISMIFIFALIVVLLGGGIILYFLGNGNNTGDDEMIVEYTPEAEITEEQARQTIVSLYFLSKDSNELVPEARLIDIKEIINSPYEKLVNLLIDGPKNEKNEKIIPDGTKLNKNYLENDCVVLDFSTEFLNFSNKNSKYKDNLINSIVNTLTELTEVNSVKFLIDGKENTEFKDVYTRKI